MRVFDCGDYKKFLFFQLAKNKENWGYQKRLAKEAGCQPSFLSRVIKGNADLSLDHLHGLCEFWKLSEDEAEFLEVLLLQTRAGTERLRKRLERRILSLRRKQTDISHRFKIASQADSVSESAYYSSWAWSALHVLASIPAFQTAEAMAARLHLSPEVVSQMLQRMEGLGFVKQQGKRWQMGRTHAHIPRDSVLCATHHMNWRMQAVQEAQQGLSDSVHFTGVYSMSRKDALKIQEELLNFIERTQRQVDRSREEEIFNFNCDFYSLA